LWAQSVDMKISARQFYELLAQNLQESRRKKVKDTPLTITDQNRRGWTM